MARLARIIIPGVPHHITQRGNGRQRVFFSNEDYGLYRDLLQTHCAANGVEVWAWCLMPNHTHLLLVPQEKDGIRAALSKVHRIYAGHIHARLKRTSHFWQGRFGSVALDEDDLLNAFRYIGLNPVRARLCAQGGNWPWASSHVYIEAVEDGVTAKGPMLSRYPDMRALFEHSQIYYCAAFERLRKAETIGRPLGNKTFLDTIEATTGRDIKPAKRGPKAKMQEVKVI